MGAKLIIILGIIASLFSFFITASRGQGIFAFSSFLTIIFFTSILAHLRLRLHLPKGMDSKDVFPNVELIGVKPDYLMFKTKDRIVGLKMMRVSSIPYTWRGLSMDDIYEHLSTYSSLMVKEDVLVSTCHLKLPVDKEDFIDSLRRSRDQLALTYEVSGAPTYQDRAREKDVALERMRNMEDPLDSRFYITVYAQGMNAKEVEECLLEACSRVKRRFESEIGVKLEDVKDWNIIDALKMIPPFPSRMAWTRQKTVRNLSLDLAFQNPFIARRLPPVESLTRGIYMGKTVDGIPFSLDMSQKRLPNMNCLIIGPMGTGKSTFAKSYVCRAYLLRNIPFWAFDIAPKGEYAELVKELHGIVIDFKEEKVNPFILYGSNPVDVAEDVSYLCTYLAGLNAMERFYFRNTVLELYSENGIYAEDRESWSDEASNNVNFVSIYEKLEKKLKKARKDEKAIIISIIEKIKPLCVGAYAFGKATINLDELYKKGIPVDFVLTGLPSHTQKAIVWSILRQINNLFYNRYGLYEDVRLNIILEEAHLWMKPVRADVPGGVLHPPLSEFMRLMRKSGVGLWAITHLPEDLGEFAPLFLEASGVLVVFGSPDIDYIEFCTDNLHLTPDEQELLVRMRRGECFLRYFGDHRPIYLQVSKYGA